MPRYRSPSLREIARRAAPRPTLRTSPDAGVSAYATTTFRAEAGGCVEVELDVQLAGGSVETGGAAFVGVTVFGRHVGQIEMDAAHLGDVLRALDACLLLAKTNGAV